MVALLRAWDGELRHEDLPRYIWNSCRLLGLYGECDLEKFTEWLDSPARHALQQVFEGGYRAFQILDQLDSQPDIEQWRQPLEQWLQGFKDATTARSPKGKEQKREGPSGRSKSSCQGSIGENSASSE
jgi:hypothetical protein